MESSSRGLIWSDISYTVPTSRYRKSSPKILLSKVTGAVLPGEMVALLGPSGAGKTTLLNALSGRLHGGEVVGHILFNGIHVSKSEWTRQSAYVEQDDTIYAGFTVEETIQFSAATKLCNQSASTKREKASKILSCLDLTEVRDSRVGNAGSTNSAISGGERKRVSIGVELVSDPDVLFLDEPTSGLDSSTASKVVHNVGYITKNRGCCTIMTLHQPSHQVLSVFDKIVLMCAGHVVFFGTLTHGITYFEQQGFVQTAGVNPGDWLLECCTLESAKQEDSLGHHSTCLTLAQLIENWSASQNKYSPKVLAEESNAVVPVSSPQNHTSRKFANSWLREFYILLRRAAIQKFRNWTTLLGSLAQSVVLTLLLGFAFFRLGDDQQSVLARNGALFFIPVNTAFTVLFPVVSVFPLERAILRKERRGNSYRVSTFFISRVLVELPGEFLTRVPYLVALYWLVNFKPAASNFFIFLGINCLLLFVGIALGFMVSSVSANLEIANIIAPLIVVIFLLFGSNLLPVSACPPWFVWLHWISFFSYAYAPLVLNEFSGRVFTCDASVDVTSAQCYRTGEELIRQYSLDRFTISQCAGFLVLIGTVYLVIGYLALSMLTRPALHFPNRNERTAKPPKNRPS